MTGTDPLTAWVTPLEEYGLMSFYVFLSAPYLLLSPWWVTVILLVSTWQLTRRWR